MLDPETGRNIPDGEAGELVLTNLAARHPVIRYRTGDIVVRRSGRARAAGRGHGSRGPSARAPRT